LPFMINIAKAVLGKQFQATVRACRDYCTRKGIAGRCYPMRIPVRPDSVGTVLPFMVQGMIHCHKELLATICPISCGCTCTIGRVSDASRNIKREPVLPISIQIVEERTRPIRASGDTKGGKVVRRFP